MTATGADHTPVKPPTPARVYYRPLDGLRAVAVLCVLAAHAGSPFPRSGGVGVDVFFVLSGFLITSILCEERWRTGTVRLGRFYARRALRLFPALVGHVRPVPAVHPHRVP